MLRKLLGVSLALGLTATFAPAQQAVQPGAAGQPGTAAQPGAAAQSVYGGRITKIDGSTVTVEPYDRATGKFGPARQYQVGAEGFRAYQMGQDNQRQPIEGGLRGNAFRNIGDQGLYSTYRMNGGRISEMNLWNDQNTFQRGYLQGLQGSTNPGGGGQDVAPGQGGAGTSGTPGR